MKHLVCILLAVFFLSSCDNTAVFKEIRKFENLSWNRMNIQYFEVPVAKGDVLDFYLFLRHYTDFPYDKLFVSITFYSPDGTMRSGEYDFELKNKNGKWKADGMGDLWDIELPIIDGMRFGSEGICKVRVENKYPRSETPGIIEIGLIARKSKN